MADACAWNLNALCFISRDVFRGVDARGVGFCLDCTCTRRARVNWVPGAVRLLDRGVGAPPDIGNETAEMIGFPESVAKLARWCARFFQGSFPGTGSTGTRSSHRDLQNDVP